MKNKINRLVFGLVVSSLWFQAPLWSGNEVDEVRSEPIYINWNENAFGYSPKAKVAMMEAMDRGNRYPRTEGRELVEALAAREQVSADWILVTPGSGPVLQMAALAYAEEGKNMITVEPGYTQLSRLFETRGGEVKYVPLNDALEHDLPAMQSAIDENTVLIYICHPNNPTGTIVDPIELKAFIDSVPEDVLVFVDEAYVEVSDGGLQRNSMIGVVRSRKNVLVSRTFSKVFGMAGLRIGYGVAHPSILAKLRPFYMGPPGLLSTVAATAALADTAHTEYNRGEYIRVRKIVTDRLDELGMEYADPQGTFVFIHTGIDAGKLQSMMEARNIIIGRPSPPLTEWARVSIGTEGEMRTFLSAFESILREHGRIEAE